MLTALFHNNKCNYCAVKPLSDRRSKRARHARKNAASASCNSTRSKSATKTKARRSANRSTTKPKAVTPILVLIQARNVL
jgi:hypothetical protein